MGPDPAPLSQAACPLLPAVRSPEGKIRLYCKGADTILLERLHPINQDLANVTTDHLNVRGAGSCGQGWEGKRRGLPRSAEPGLCPVLGGDQDLGTLLGSVYAPSLGRLQEYAGEGLRTLVLAYKDLEESYYEDWSERLHQAGSAPEAREDHLARLYDEVERNMMVRGLGALGGGEVAGGQPLLTSHLFGSPPAAWSHGHRGQTAAGCPRNRRHPDAGQHQDLGADRGQTR